MLRWYRETYAATATDAAGDVTMRLWTPSGVFHAISTSKALTQREDWRVHFMQVVVLHTTTGYPKHGLYGELILGLDYGGGWAPIPTANRGHVHPNYGLLYRGAPFIATHGIGWAFYMGALSDTDKVLFRTLYEPIPGRGIQ